MEFECVIGLEVHAQLMTQSKIFSGSSTAYGASANTQACAVDIGLPGVLPVMNRQAALMAATFGLSVGATVNPVSVFARKNYFYPDLPKGYQISQYEIPVVSGGSLEITTETGAKTIRITRAHLEEDAGKSLHEDFHGMTGIDLNRAGTPLLEIVSEPDLRSPAEAVAYLKKLHTLVRTLKICDGNMQEGSFRCDANISIRPRGETILGTRTELKNINSFRFVERALHHEIDRQISVVETGGTIVQETRLYDPDADLTRPMRGKEEAHDYRYFPEPDIQPVTVTVEDVQLVKDSLPPLPRALYQKYTSTFKLSEYDALNLTENKEIALFFEEVLEYTKNYKAAANWVMGDIKSYLNEKAIHVSEFPISAKNIGGLIALIDSGKINNSIASQKVFPAMLESNEDAVAIAEKNGWIQESDEGSVLTFIQEVITNHPDEVARFKAGEKKLTGFFMGQLMKVSKGKADPKVAGKLLNQELNK